MRYAASLFALALCATFCFAQQSVGTSATKTANASVQAPQEAGPPPDPDQLIAYRFRLAAPDAAYSLVAVNGSDKPGRFLFRGLNAELESKPQNLSPQQIEPGATVTVPATALNWAEFECVYVEASRRIELRLVRTDRPKELVIATTRNETLYDIVSEQRLGEIPFTEFDQAVSLLGATPSAPTTLKANLDLRVYAAQLRDKSPQGPEMVFLVVQLKTRSAPEN